MFQHPRWKEMAQTGPSGSRLVFPNFCIIGKLLHY
jgi:hypothetical protein